MVVTEQHQEEEPVRGTVPARLHRLRAPADVPPSAAWAGPLPVRAGRE
jgi:hypothetical protein